MKLSRILICILVLHLGGCAGCSKSGRESLKSGKPNEKFEEELKQGISKSDRNEEIGISTTPAQISNLPSSLSELYEENRKAVFLIFSTNDGSTGVQGSGFFVSPTGLAVSNKHVFDNYKDHYIKLHDGSILAVSSVVKENENFDYVIFRVNTNGLHANALVIAAHLPKIGDEVFTIGNPKGLEQTLSKGIISSYRESNKYIQTTAEITNGSSGGPLFNMSGQVVGITTSGYGEANLNFAVNIQLLDIAKYLE
jgi:serine protease Do